DLDDALSRLDDCLYVADETEEQSHVVKALCLQGRCHALRGEDAEAEVTWREALSHAREQGARMPMVQAAAELARFLADRDRADEARGTLGAALADFGEGDDSRSLSHARALLTGRAPAT